MTRHALRQLIEAFCRASGTGEPDAILDGAMLLVDDVAFCLHYNEEAAPEVLTLYCEFGKPPAREPEKVYETLLHANLLLSHVKGPQQAFGMTPDTGYVVLAEHLPLQGLDAAGLQSSFLSLAEQARAWREDYLLEDAGQVPDWDARA